MFQQQKLLDSSVDNIYNLESINTNQSISIYEQNWARDLTTNYGVKNIGKCGTDCT